jgi:hypothetical protein
MNAPPRLESFATRVPFLTGSENLAAYDSR